MTTPKQVKTVLARARGELFACVEAADDLFAAIHDAETAAAVKVAASKPWAPSLEEPAA